MLRRLVHHRAVVERRVHMREIGPARLQPLDPLERLAQREMAGVRAVLERVYDERVETGEAPDRGRREIADVAAIGEIADAIAERADVAVDLLQRLELDRSARPVDAHHALPPDGSRWRQGSADSRCPAASRNSSRKPRAGVPAFPVRMDRHALPGRDGKPAQIVDAMYVIGVRMRIEHRVDAPDPGRDHLLAEIGTGVDDDRRAPAGSGDLLDKQRRAASAVARLGRVAGAPVARDARHARRRCATEHREATPDLHLAPRGIFEKMRKTFSVVRSAISSKLTPRVSASTRAVCTTKDGSFGNPDAAPAQDTERPSPPAGDRSAGRGRWRGYLPTS